MSLILSAYPSIWLLVISSMWPPVSPLTQVLESVPRSQEDGESTVVLDDVKIVKSPLGSVDLLEPPGSPNRTQGSPQRGNRPDTPMLNYIFDTHQHSHHTDRLSSPRIISEGMNVSAHSHDKTHLDCRVSSLRDKLVTWVRRKPEDGLLDILTIGQQTFTADTRFSVSYLPPEVWRLTIAETVPGDSGAYHCQLSTHPPLSSTFFLTVHRARIEVTEGDKGKDRYYERNSTLSLGCRVRHFPGAQITWLHHTNILNDDTTRGGVSVRSEIQEDGMESVVQLARLTQSDAGLYTCLVPGQTHNLSDSVNVHVLNESLAELHQASAGVPWRLSRWLLCLPSYLAGHALLTLTLRR